MKKIQHIISTGILAAVLGYAAPAQADFVSGEVFGSNKGALLEVKGSASVGVNPNVQYFTRVRRFRGYDGKDTSFMQNELSLGEVYGLRVVAQGRLAGEKLVPQAGISYSKKIGEGSVVAALSSSLQEKTLAEFLTFGVIPLTKDVLLELEQVVSANADVIKASSRAHVGYKLDNFTVGVAGEVDYGKNMLTVPKLGVYVRLRSK